MAAGDLWYPKAKGAQLGLGTNQGPIDWDADPIYGMLVTTNYVTGVTLATQKTHQFRSDVTGVAGAEVTGTGYTAGGVLLASPTITQSGDNYYITFTNPAWASSTITARGLIIFKRVGADLTTPADDPVLLQLDFGANITSTNGTFTVTLNASGVLLLQ